ncbi:LytR C-terminal domain-containing protein [Candidatus Uhrbacteria bacterium]|jgi:hypothetical protein|nr:MAG: LytR C-terminal domain-containing protein [Candidatus Uhrbacteria bacterium]
MIKRTSAVKTPSSRAKASQAPIALETAPMTPAPSNGSGYSRVIPIVIALVLVIGGGAYFVSAAMNGKSGSDMSNIEVRDGVDPKEVANIIERVRELVVADSDEMPTVATVQDISVLRPQNPTLYRDAQNGDKLLVWSDKVVVYSATKDRLLVVMPINVTPDTTTQNTPPDARVAAATAAEEPSVTIEVRNGSATPGAARVLNDKLKAEGFQTLAPADAKNKAYPATIIYNATGKAIPKTLEKLIASTGGTVVTAAEGEGRTSADLLIIIGAK